MTKEIIDDYIKILENEDIDWIKKLEVIEKIRNLELKNNEQKEIFSKKLLVLLIDYLRHEQEDIVQATIHCLGDHHELTKPIIPDLLDTLKWKTGEDIRKSIVSTLERINGKEVKKYLHDTIPQTRNSIEKAYLALALARVDLEDNGLNILSELHETGKLKGWLEVQFKELLLKKFIFDKTKKVEKSKKIAERDKQIKNYKVVIKDQEELILQYIKLNRDQINKISKLSKQLKSVSHQLTLNPYIKTNLENSMTQEQFKQWKQIKKLLKQTKKSSKTQEEIRSLFAGIYNLSRLFRVRDAILFFDNYIGYIIEIDLPKFYRSPFNYIFIVHKIDNKPISEDELIEIHLFSRRKTALVILFTAQSVSKDTSKLIKSLSSERQIIVQKTTKIFETYFNSIFTIDFFILNILAENPFVKKYFSMR